MISNFNGTPGALKGTQYCSKKTLDNKYRIFEIIHTWSGGPEGLVLHVDLQNQETLKVTRLTLEEFKDTLTIPQGEKEAQLTKI